MDGIRSTAPTVNFIIKCTQQGMYNDYDSLHCKNYKVVLTQTWLSQLLDLYHVIVRDIIIVMGRNHSGMPVCYNISYADNCTFKI